MRGCRRVKRVRGGRWSVLTLGGACKRKRLAPSYSWDALLGDLDVYGLCDGGSLDMGTADVLRTDAAVREGVGPAGTSNVGGATNGTGAVVAERTGGRDGCWSQSCTDAAVVFDLGVKFGEFLGLDVEDPFKIGTYIRLHSIDLSEREHTLTDDARGFVGVRVVADDL